MADLNDASDKVHESLSSIIHEQQPATMISKWIVLAEVIDEEGGRSMWSLSSEGISPWDRVGMLKYQLMCVRIDRSEDD